MRRTHDSLDSGSGSDSFLDIVANIVGILIILIVIVGLRVAQTPPVKPTPPPPQTKADPPKPPPAQGIAKALPLLAMNVDPFPKKPSRESFFGDVPPAPPRVIPKAPRPSPRLLSAIENSESDQRNALAAAAAASKTIASVDAETRALQSRIAALGKRSTEMADLRDTRSKLLGRAEAAIADRKKRIRDAKAELAMASKPKPKVVQKLQHRIAPIGKQVQGEEHHFHLQGGRITAVPIKTLLGELKTTIRRRKSWLIRQGRATGEIGPIAGWKMQYAFVAKAMPDVGPGVVQVALSKWQLSPTHDILSESATDALRPNSRFRRALRGATTVTIWVYADSFAEYRQLAEFARDLGHHVAARPLPAGSFISGSPRGTRSVSQ